MRPVGEAVAREDVVVVVHGAGTVVPSGTRDRRSGAARGRFDGCAGVEQEDAVEVPDEFTELPAGAGIVDGLGAPAAQPADPEAAGNLQLMPAEGKGTAPLGAARSIARAGGGGEQDECRHGHHRCHAGRCLSVDRCMSFLLVEELGWVGSQCSIIRACTGKEGCAPAQPTSSRPVPARPSNTTCSRCLARCVRRSSVRSACQSASAAVGLVDLAHPPEEGAGLNKYDGYGFTVYRNDPADVNSIPSNYISALCEDRSGILWIGTALGGLCSYDRTRETFHRYQYNPSDHNSITSDRITSIFEDSRRNLWIGTHRGLNMMDPLRKKIRCFLHSAEDTSSVSDDDMQSISEDRNSNLWIATARGADVLNYESNTFTRFVHVQDDPGSLESNHVYTVLQASDGSLWFGTSRSLDRYTKGKFTHYTIHDPKEQHYNVTQIVEDPQGKLWLISNFSLVRFDPRSSQYEFVREHPGTTTMYMDDTGILWLGTAGAGVDRFSTVGTRFELHEGERIENVMFGDIISRLDRFAGKKFVYPDIHGQSFAEDSKDNIWISTVFDGLFCYDVRQKKFTRYQYRTDLEHRDVRRKIYFPYVGPSGRIWIGTRFGVAELDWRTGRFRYYPLYPEDYAFSNFDVLSGSYDITCLSEDSSGVLWVGTPILGLIRFDPANGSENSYTFRSDDTTSLSSNFILSIEPDPFEPSRYLWIGTDGGGMNKFDKKTGRAERFTVESGLPNNVVYGILADHSGKLWMSTNRGLCRFDPLTRSLRVFDVQDGLQSNEFNRREFFRLRDGKMYFGGIGGVNAFYPDQVKDNAHIPPIVITGFKIFNLSVTPGDHTGILSRPITATDTIMVDYRENILSFEFAALDYSIPLKNRYAYMLEGFDPDWIMGGTKRTATFTNLDPGKYVLHVKGSNNDGVWNEKGTSLVLIIKPLPEAYNCHPSWDRCKSNSGQTDWRPEVRSRAHANKWDDESCPDCRRPPLRADRHQQLHPHPPSWRACPTPAIRLLRPQN